MGTVRVIFSRRHHLGSVVLRAAMWSNWSHCGIIDGRDVIEAVAFKGVTTRPLGEFMDDASAWEVIEIPADDPAAVIRAARSQIGKPYDWFGVSGLAVRRHWQEPDAWFCSELVIWALHEAGTILFRIDVWRVTPRDLYIRTY